jgi:hypothetical protein
MTSTDVTAFDIHLFAFKRSCHNWFVDGKGLNFKEFRNKANDHFANLYDGQNDEFLKAIFDWFVDKEIFGLISNKFAPEIYVYNQAKNRSLSIGGEFAKQFS